MVKRLSLCCVDLSVQMGIQHPRSNMLIFGDPPCCAENATALFGTQQLLNILGDIEF